MQRSCPANRQAARQPIETGRRQMHFHHTVAAKELPVRLFPAFERQRYRKRVLIILSQRYEQPKKNAQTKAHRHNPHPAIGQQPLQNILSLVVLRHRYSPCIKRSVSTLNRQRRCLVFSISYGITFVREQRSSLLQTSPLPPSHCRQSPIKRSSPSHRQSYHANRLS